MKICMWGNVAHSLSGSTKGGGELQISLLAKALCKAGNEIVVIDYHIDSEFTTPEGIKVIPVHGWNKGIRVLRSITHRFPSLFQTFINQNADIYYCRIRDFRHLISFFAARRNHARFFLGIASDLDVMNTKSRITHYYLKQLGLLWWFFNGVMTEIFFPYLLKKADKVIVQHRGQESILHKKAIDSIVLPNMIERIYEASDLVARTFDYIYVGSLDRRKGFVQLSLIIKQNPSKRFLIVGSPRDKKAQSILTEIRKLSNVQYAGQQPHSAVIEYIRKSKALVSTSPVEGFPNVFIESWACGIPVISLYVDPGNVIQTENLGYYAKGCLDLFSIYISTFKPEKDFSKRSQSYVKRVHLLNDEKVKTINLIFSSLLSDP